MTRLTGASKYHNVKVVIDGYKFDSKAEGNRYIDLTLMKEAKVIKSFELQPVFELTAGIKYRGDFLVVGKDGKQWVEDVKGYETDVFKLKRKLFEFTYPNIELRIIK